MLVAIVLDCIDPRMTKGRPVTNAAVISHLGSPDDARVAHTHRVPGPSPMLAGTRLIIPDETDEEDFKRIFLATIDWNLKELEDSETPATHIFIGGHTGGCAAEQGTDVEHPHLTHEHLIAAVNFLRGYLSRSAHEDVIKREPIVVGMIQHVSGETIEHVEFLD